MEDASLGERRRAADGNVRAEPHCAGVGSGLSEAAGVRDALGHYGWKVMVLWVAMLPPEYLQIS
jgi:hypothetical protein